MTEEEIKKLQEELEAERTKAKALESKAARLEDESKKNKTRAQTAEEKINEAEKAKLEEQGKLEELLRVEREEKSKLSKTLETRTQGVLREKLRAEMSKHAKDAHDVDMLLKVTDHKDLLSINEDELSVSGIEDFVGKCRESHSYLFKKKTMGSGEDKKPKGDDNKTDVEKYYEELDACTSRKELEAIKKKYGK